MQIKIIGLKPLVDAFINTPNLSKKHLTIALYKSAEAVRIQAIHVHKWRIRSGRSIRDIKKLMLPQKLAAQVFLDNSFTNTKNNVSYLVYQHEGWNNVGKRYYPVQKKALRWADGGAFTFAKYIDGGKKAPDQFLYAALQNKQAFISALFDKAIEKTLLEV